MRAPAAFALALLVAGCNIQETTPRTQIDRLRVLSVRIDGPLRDGNGQLDPNGKPAAELAPGDTATLTPLVLAPGIAPVGDMTAEQTVCLQNGQPSWDRDGANACAAGSTEGKVYRFWFWCPPVAQTLSYDPCTSTDVLASPEQIPQTTGIAPLGPTCDSTPVQPLPAPTACVRPPPDLFSGLPPDALVRRRGVLMNVLLLAVAGTESDFAAGGLPQLLATARTQSVPVAVVALKRIPVLDQPTNHNPLPTAVAGASGAILDGALLGHEGQLAVSADPPESYVQVNPDGTETPKAEQLDTAWFSGFGRFDSAHTLLTETNSFTPATGKDLDQPPPGTGDYSMPFGVVVRDGRGGEGWLVRTVTVARP